MTQPKRTRQRRPKPELSAVEFAYCEDAINRYVMALADHYDYGLTHPDRYAFLSKKITQWYEMLLIRGGVTE